MRDEIDVEEVVLDGDGLFAILGDLKERWLEIMLEIGPYQEATTRQLTTEERQCDERDHDGEVELARVQVLILLKRAAQTRLEARFGLGL